jgi:hypothetical protein
MKKDRLIFTAFYQGKDAEGDREGNCASIAIIKAAMYTYGENAISYVVKNGVYQVTLKNGAQVSFTEDELDLVVKDGSFVLGDYQDDKDDGASLDIYGRYRDFAHICFASMCKMVASEGDYNSRAGKTIYPEDFELALETLNDGTHTPSVHELLGLDEHVTPAFGGKFKKRVWADVGMVFWTPRHAMFAAKGRLDWYGNPIRVRGRLVGPFPHRMLVGGFKLKE